MESVTEETESVCPNPTARDYAKDFLYSLSKVPSHYCRSSSNKQYIEPEFASLWELHRKYTKKFQSENKPRLKITQFTLMFERMNLCLFKPKKDVCDVCCGYEARTIDEVYYADHIKRRKMQELQKSQINREQYREIRRSSQ